MCQFFQPVSFDIKFNSLSTTYLQMLTSVLKGYTTVILLQCALTLTLGSTVPALMDTQAMEHTAKV